MTIKAIRIMVGVTYDLSKSIQEKIKNPFGKKINKCTTKFFKKLMKLVLEFFFKWGEESIPPIIVKINLKILLQKDFHFLSFGCKNNNFKTFQIKFKK